MLYYELFLLVSLVPVFILDLVFLIWFSIWLLINQIIRKKCTKTSEIKEIALATTNSSEISDPTENRKTRFTEEWWKNTWWWVFSTNVVYLGLVLVTFDYLPIYIGIPLFTIFALIAWVLLLPNPKDNPFPRTLKKYHLRALYKIKRNLPLFIGISVFLVIAIFLTNFMMEGACVTIQPYAFTTKFSRGLTTPHCKDGIPCNIYLTLTEDPATSIFVNFQSDHQEISSKFRPTVYYSLSGGNFTEISGYSQVIDMRDFRRTIHCIRLDGLTENSDYVFRVEYAGKRSPELKFRTTPATGAINFVAGGDMGTTPTSRKVSERAAATDPAFAVIGGDISYENGMRSCYGRWDDWFRDWSENMVGIRGNLIPMLLAIGNHEAGGFGVSEDDVPYYINFFPGAGDGSFQNRKTYHSHKISNHTLVLALDTDVVTPPSDQVDWMENEFSVKFHNKFAAYHVPLYSGGGYDRELSAKLRQNWLTTFDGNNLTAAFENHDHIYHRSKILKNDKVSDHGTLYVGDGSWGTDLSPFKKEVKWYMAKLETRNFFIKVEVDEAGTNMTMIDKDGEIFDSVNLIVT